MKDLKLIDGKFYRNGVLEPLKFGDKDQIALMKELNDLAADLNGDGVIIDPDLEEVIKISVDFRCLCGKNVYFSEMECSVFDDPNEEMKGEKATCQCGKKYIIDNHLGDMVVKILGNK